MNVYLRLEYSHLKVDSVEYIVTKISKYLCKLKHFLGPIRIP